MTESEWLHGADPLPLLLCLRDKSSDRQLRRFAIDCCRLWDGLNTDERAAEALNAVEQSIEGNIGAAELHAANKEAWQSFDLTLPENAAKNAMCDASQTDLAIMLTHKDAWHSAYCVSWIIRCKMRNRVDGQCVLLGDIFGAQICDISVSAPDTKPSQASDGGNI
jgi:hypothetical protein